MNRLVSRHERALVVAVLRACAEDLPDQFELKRRCFTVCANELEARPLSAVPPIRSSSTASEPVTQRLVQLTSLEVELLWDAARAVLHRARLRYRTGELQRAVPEACRALSSQRTDAPTREEILGAVEAIMEFSRKCSLE